MPETLRAAPSVNNAITAQKLNENQLKYLIRRTSYQVLYMIRMYTRAGSAAAPRGMQSIRSMQCGAGPRAGPRARAPPRTHFRIIGILTGSEDSGIDFMQNSEFSFVTDWNSD